MPGPAHEPRLPRIAALVADATRARMLSYLLGGELASAGELAACASVSAATASAHLAKLLDAGLVACEPRGRHRYYRIADAEVAHALEALALVAERDTHERAWASPERQALRRARCCYGHLAGQLGVALFESLLQADALHSTTDGFALSAHGQAWLQRLGLEAPAPTGRRRYAYRCLDWSERRDHLAGQLAESLYRQFVAQGWLRREHGRALEITPRAHTALLPHLLSNRL